MLTDDSTDRPSSQLAQGVAKEKEIATDLKALEPYADVNLSPKTGDGGYDIAVENSGERSLIEVKDWNRPLSAYKVREYADRHADTDASFTIFNTGGFTNGAKEAAEDAGIKLVNEVDHEAPSQLHRVIAAGIRRWKLTERGARKIANSLTDKAVKLGVRASETVGRWAENQISQAQARSKVSALKAISRKQQLLTLFVSVLIVGSLWLLCKRINGSLSKEDRQKITRILSRVVATLVTAIVLGILISLIVDWLRSK